ncbi:MAG: 2,3-bisphosphoglycerate-independent phosphoglycerate mutase [Candidatus Omnitrophota bacterium]|nr:2,3-bisphosphoglycerate-independent phosphoglycerate mutase [Candidatus Omnitrophota bacterium]
MGNDFLEGLINKNNSKIVFLVMDGVGGLPLKEGGKTELAAANTPNLDRLAGSSICGILDPIMPGITPGSGPGHLALFGYDPLRHNIGRGALSALGIDFKLKEGDVCARINFATMDGDGKIVDRRAGRLDTEENRRLCEKLRKNIKIERVELFIETVKEHRAVLVLRGEDLDGHILDTDPQKNGLLPLDPVATTKNAKKTRDIVQQIIQQAKSSIRNEKPANMILLRGFARFKTFRSMEERFGLKALAIAQYPMYKGVARLIGMDIAPQPQDLEEEIKLLKDNLDKYDFFFIHFKKTDSSGEDGNFNAKVKEIEKIDRLIPGILKLQPDVIIVTADHSTPAKLKGHSWHPVPVIVHSQHCRADDVKRFDEISCIKGGIGRMPAFNLMNIALANALRLKKFGA